MWLARLELLAPLGQLGLRALLAPPAQQVTPLQLLAQLVRLAPPVLQAMRQPSPALLVL